jgi:hypothetical protein
MLPVSDHHLRYSNIAFLIPDIFTVEVRMKPSIFRVLNMYCGLEINTEAHYSKDPG